MLCAINVRNKRRPCAQQADPYQTHAFGSPICLNCATRLKSEMSTTERKKHWSKVDKFQQQMKGFSDEEVSEHVFKQLRDELELAILRQEKEKLGEENRTLKRKLEQSEGDRKKFMKLAAEQNMFLHYVIDKEGPPPSFTQPIPRILLVSGTDVVPSS